MSSKDWNLFYESYFGDSYMAWHDGLDENALLSLTGEEREQAEKLLIAALGTSDYRPASGLAALQSSEAASKLKEDLPNSSGSARIQTARALWQIEKYPPAEKALVEVLQTDSFWGTRMEAARELRNVSTPGVISALWKALKEDSSDLVRSHAAASLLSLYNISTYNYDKDSLAIRVMDESKENRDKAIKKLEQLIKREGRLGEK